MWRAMCPLAGASDIFDRGLITGDDGDDVLDSGSGNDTTARVTQPGGGVRQQRSLESAPVDSSSASSLYVVLSALRGLLR